MNRVFLAMVVVAFGWAAVREVTEPVAAPAPVAAAVVDPAVDQRLARLEARVDRHPLIPADRAPDRRPMRALTDGMVDASITAVILSLGLAGGMCLFLGILKLAEASGLLAVLARLVRPLMVRLFPQVPSDHPAMGAMIMNLCANALGLGNAATPFGIKAMQELERLNRHPGTATDAMCLFLAINTSSVTLLPTTVIVWRETVGSENASGILPTTLLASLIATSAAIALCLAVQRFWPVPAGPGREPERSAAEASEAYPAWVTAAAFVATFAAIPLSVVYGRAIAPWVVPLLLVGLLGYAAARGVAVYEQFVAGARDGIEVSLRIIPYLVAMLVAVGMLQSSGALGAITHALAPLTAWFGLPAEALPMALIRPLSGSGATGVMVAAMREHGPDSYIGFLVSTIQGSSETTFYVLAVYFGAVQIRNMRHAPWVGIAADVVGVLASVLAVKLYFYGA
jgi:spore maturation protein SpmA